MVMRPEPWGEALDAIRGSEGAAGGAASGRPGARRGAVHPGPRPGAGCRALAGLRLRALRGNRQAGHREAALHGRVSVLSLGDYVLNGGGSPPSRWSGGRPARARRRRQQRVARRGVLTGAPAGAPGLHQAGGLARPRRARVPAGRPRPHRWLAAGGVAAPHRRAPPRPGPRPRWAISPTWPSSRASSRTPRLLVLQRCCWLGEAGSTTPGHPAVGRDPGRRPGLIFGMANLGGSLARSAHRLGARPSRHGRYVGGRPAHGRPRLAGSRAGSSAPGYAEQAAPPEVTDLWLITGAQSARNIQLYKRAGYRVVPGRHAGHGADAQTAPLTAA